MEFTDNQGRAAMQELFDAAEKDPVVKSVALQLFPSCEADAKKFIDKVGVDPDNTLALAITMSHMVKIISQGSPYIMSTLTLFLGIGIIIGKRKVN